VAVTQTNVLSLSNAVYTLSFTLATNQNGSLPVALSAVENGLAGTNALTVTVKPVSQPPVFVLATNLLVVAENPSGAGTVSLTNFLTGISPGAGNLPGLTWTFGVMTATNSGSTNATFAQFPGVTTNGTLSFRTKDYSFGTNLLQVVMTDSGGSTNGGLIASTNSLQLQVTQGQYPPAFTGLTNVAMWENAATNLGLAFTLFDPLTTNFTVTAVSANTNVVTVSVGGVGTARTLWFAPVTNAFGSNILVTVTANDGALTNSTALLATVNWVNQPPSFNLAESTVTADIYDQAISLPNVLTNILAGPTNESNQTVTFIVTNSNPGLFLAQPAVTAGGTLNFTPGKQGGTVTLGIKVHDNGGTNNGGVDTSAIQTLSLVIPPNPYPYLEGTFTGLFYDTNAVSPSASGFFSLVLTNDGAFTGYLLCAGDSNVFAGQFSISNSSASVTAASYALQLTADTGPSWTESIMGSVSNATAGWNVTLQSYLAGYSAAFPTAMNGVYVMAMPGLDDPTAGPVGDSIFNVIINSAGDVDLTGNLADNTYVSRTGQLSLDGFCPVYVPLYGGAEAGLLMGWLDFTGVASGTGTNLALVWFDEAGATPALYPDGFTNAAALLAESYNPALPNLLAITSGTVILSGGDLVAPITNAVTISDNIIVVDPAATNGLNLQINAASGEITGSFHNPDGQTNYIESVLLQNQNTSSGYFNGTHQVGSFNLSGD